MAAIIPNGSWVGSVELDDLDRVGGGEAGRVGVADELHPGVAGGEAVRGEPALGGFGSRLVRGDRHVVVDPARARPLDRRGEVAAGDRLRLGRAEHHVHHSRARQGRRPATPAPARTRRSATPCSAAISAGTDVPEVAPEQALAPVERARLVPDPALGLRRRHRCAQHKSPSSAGPDVASVSLEVVSVATAPVPAAEPEGRGPREPGDRPLRRDRRPGQAQAAAGDVPPRPGRPDAGALPDRRRRPPRDRGRGVPRAGPAGDRGFRPRGQLAARPGTAFAESLRFVGVGDGFEPLGEAVASAREELGGDPGVLFYLSLPPGATAGTVEAIGALGLGEGARVITEKPFGTDLESARELNALLHSVFDERCIYRIDHYLGREAVQNLLALRFANGMFEPVWNRNHIDHVQIDIPETLSIEMRGSFYEQTGAFRDMVVTHLFQVLGFVAMEPPTSLRAEAAGDRAREGLRLDAAAARRRTWSAASTPATARRTASPPTRRPRPSSRSRPSSTTGAGRGCRSTCAPASDWPRTATC